MASKLGPIRPRGVTWKGAGAWSMVSQVRQENFSRTVWMTFHWRGTASMVSVTSSPSFERFVPPQQEQEVGPGMTTRSRDTWAGNGLREGFLRGKATT